PALGVLERSGTVPADVTNESPGRPHAALLVVRRAGLALGDEVVGRVDRPVPVAREEESPDQGPVDEANHLPVAETLGEAARLVPERKRAAEITLAREKAGEVVD